MNYEKLPYRLKEALKERERTVAQIEAMTPEQAVGEYAAWHLGDYRWAEDFIELIDAARKAAKEVKS